MDLAIGQQQIFTPLQLAVMMGAIGNTKERYQPFLAQKIKNYEGEIILNREIGDSVFSLSQIKDSSFEAVKIGLSNVVQEGGGTGRRARVEGIPIGGKSGTAQNPLADHALFVAVAPLDNPTIAVAVVVENVGGGGSKFAAPIVGNILNYYFDETEEGKKVAAKYRGERKTVKR